MGSGIWIRIVDFYRPPLLMAIHGCSASRTNLIDRFWDRLVLVICSVDFRRVCQRIIIHLLSFGGRISVQERSNHWKSCLLLNFFHFQTKCSQV